MMPTKQRLLFSSFFIFHVLYISHAIAQQTATTKEQPPANIRPEHTWWNLLQYTISVTPDYNNQFIRGSNAISFVALKAGNVMRIDLQEPMAITKVTWRNAPISFKKEKNACLVTFPGKIAKGNTETITVFFEGRPKAAVNPPFDNGWIWAKDKKGRPWISVACEGSGASIWLPCKDVLYDEPDNGVIFSMTVPDTLVAVANGRLQKKERDGDHSVTYTWRVTNPINNYNIIPYIGKYITWHEDYAGSKGKLDCDYWVLDYSREKAQKHLQQADTMLRCFDYWLGPYPFYEDSYKLVEAPMPGMEHQSAIAYGNGFENGYSGKNLSGTVWGLQWDFILIHESGHEWFGNSITASGDGDSWIHEGFTKYLETLYTEYTLGKEAATEYALGTWKRIKNDEAIIGGNTSDKYYKASAMLHMIRQVLGDTVFRGWLRELNRVFYHRTVNTQQVLTALNDYAKGDFTAVFNQFLRTTQVPVFEYYVQENFLYYRWSNCVDDFDIPLKAILNNKDVLIYPTTNWQKLSVGASNAILVDSNFYVSSKLVVKP